MKRVAAGAHFQIPCHFEPAKHPDDEADYCLVQAPATRFYIRELGCALWENSGEGSAQ